MPSIVKIHISKQLNKMEYVTFEIVEKETNLHRFEANIGDLLIRITDKGQEKLKQLMSVSGLSDKAIFINLIVDQLGSEGWTIVAPKLINALTDSLILADGHVDDETDEKELKEMNIYWSPNHQTQSYIDGFIKKGYVIFTLSS